MTTLTGKTRWTIAILAVVAALMAALVAQLHDYSASSTISQRPAPREHRDGDTPEALAWSRQRANLPPCPAAGNGPGAAALRGVVVVCAGGSGGAGGHGDTTSGKNGSSGTASFDGNPGQPG